MGRTLVRSKDIERAYYEHGYRVRDGRVIVDCNATDASITHIDIIHALYSHVAKRFDLPALSLDDVEKVDAKARRLSCHCLRLLS